MNEIHNKQLCHYCGRLNTISFKKAIFKCEICRNISEITIKQKKLTIYSNKMVQAELGNRNAQLEVAQTFYFNSSFEKALFWALKVVPHFPQEANFLIARIYAYGLTKKTKALDYAIDYYKKSDLKDKQVILNYMAALFERKNLADVKNLLKISKRPIVKSTIISNFYVGLVYLYGFQIKKDFKRAAFYLEKTFKLGDKSVSRLLGIIYVDKIYGIKDYKKGLYYNKVAAELNFSGSISNLGYMYAEGLGVKKDYFKAFEYYKKSKMLGDSYGAYNYAENLYKGLGTKKNKKDSLRIIKSLSKKGFKPAIKFLSKINKKSTTKAF
jgi:TPR repeat protein